MRELGIIFVRACNRIDYCVIFVAEIKIKKLKTRKMKTTTITKAIEIGFDFEAANFETKEELELLILDYLMDNGDALEQREDECNVTGSGNRQHVSYKDYECSGEIINWSYDVLRKDADHKIFHSSFVSVDNSTGMPYQMNLFEFVGENEYNKR